MSRVAAMQRVILSIKTPFKYTSEFAVTELPGSSKKKVKSETYWCYVRRVTQIVRVGGMSGP